MGEGGDLNARINALVSEQTSKIHSAYCETVNPMKQKLVRAQSGENNIAFTGKK